MPAVSPYSPKAYTTAGGSPVNWYSVKGYLTDGGTAQIAKKVLIRNADNTAWIEIWNARPIIISSSAVSANDGTNNTKLTITGTIDTLNLSTTVYVAYKKTGAALLNETASITLGASYGAQSYSFVLSGLSENTEYAWTVIATSDGGQSLSNGTTTTNINCTAGSTGFAPVVCSDCSSSIGQWCGLCGVQYKTVTRTKYGKTGCSNTYYSTADFPNFDTVGWTACSETGMVGTSSYWELQNPNNYPTGQRMWIGKNDLSGDIRYVEVQDLFVGSTFGDVNNCHPNVCGPTCSSLNRCAVYASYTVYKCPGTGALVWTTVSCEVLFCI